MSYISQGAVASSLYTTGIAPTVGTATTGTTATPSCASGQEYSATMKRCIPVCPRNTAYNLYTNRCMPVANPVCLPTEYLDPDRNICRPMRTSNACPPGQIFGPGGVCVESTALRAINQSASACGKSGLPTDYFQCAKALVIRAAHEGDLPPKYGGTIAEVTAWLGQPVPGQTGDHSNFAANWLSSRWKKGSLVRVRDYLSYIKAQGGQESKETATWEEAKAAAEAAAQQQLPATPSGLPKWILPVAIGGAAIAAVLILKRKK